MRELKKLRCHRHIIYLIVLWFITASAVNAQIDSNAVNQSPYSVIYNHLYYLQDDSYKPDRAALSFNLPNSEARKMAVQLKKILDGKGIYVDISRLPRNSNYVDSSINESVYIIDKKFPSIFVEEKAGLWFYSQNTLDAIPELFKKTYPLGLLLSSWFEQDAWHQQFLGIRIWQWLSLVGLFLVFVLLFKIVQLLFRPLIRYVVHSRFGRSIGDDLHIDRSARLIGLLISARFILFFLPALEIPIKINAFLIKGLIILSIFFVIFLVVRIVTITFNYFERLADASESKMDDQLVSLLKPLAIVLIWIAGIIYILTYLDVNVAALLAGVSIGGLALALAAQDTVKNLFGSLMIFLDKPFKIGDWIHFDDIDGTVEKVSVRSTRIRTFANSLTYVPNGMLANMVVDNMGLRVFRRYKTEIAITYDTPPHLMDVFVSGIREIIKMHPATRKDYFEVHLNSFGNSSLNILLYCFFKAATWSDELKARHQIMQAIITLAYDLGVRFAFPTQTLHIEEFPMKGATTPKPQNMEDAANSKKKSIEKIQTYFSDDKEEDNAKFKPLGGS